MGFFGKLKDVANIATLGQVTFFEKQLQLGGKIVKVSIDLHNDVVRIGEEIFRAAPGEVFFPHLGPLAGLLKNEVEDELIMLNPLGLVPSITVFVDAALVVGDLIGVVQHRTMFPDELKVARHVFGNSIKRSGEIKFTNLAGFGGRPFAVPTHAGGTALNMGRYYDHEKIMDIPTLIHELTHAWQIQQSILPEVFICNGALVQLQHTIGEGEYDYEPGEQWSKYGLEQQAHIVENWAQGTHAVDSIPMALASPLFRYINGNVRKGDKGARTAKGGSVRTWLAEANVKTGSLRRINPPRP